MKRMLQRIFWPKGRKRKVIHIMAISLVVIPAAWAAWTLTASNTPIKAKTGTLQAVTFSPAQFADLNVLYPGTTVDGKVLYENPNASAVTIISTAGTPVVTADSACPVGQVNFTASALVGLSVPAGSGTLNVPGAFTLAPTAPNSCQNTEFTVTVPTITYGFGS